ncbi:elongation factor 1-alpha, partial [Trifolium medium]|nr:elongation factor 1-alpha [Trifolium medium]
MLFSMLIKASANRELAFLDCAKTCQVEYKGSIILDVETRWNSTHDMLKAALKLEKTFDELEATDSKYRKELEKRQDVPTFLDWEKAREISQFLEIFKASTLHISGSSYVKSNLYLRE